MVNAVSGRSRNTNATGKEKRFRRMRGALETAFG
jgi:hypothetical protein